MTVCTSRLMRRFTPPPVNLHPLRPAHAAARDCYGRAGPYSGGARQTFEEFCRRHNRKAIEGTGASASNQMSYRWREESGSPADIIPEEARLADLAVLAKDEADGGGIGVLTVEGGAVRTGVRFCSLPGPNRRRSARLSPSRGTAAGQPPEPWRQRCPCFTRQAAS